MRKDRKRRKSHRSTASQRRQKYPPDWVPINVPDNLDEMYVNWMECEEPNIGWCLLCDQPIRSIDDLISGTSSHDCERGRALEQKIREAEADEKITRARHGREG